MSKDLTPRQKEVLGVIIRSYEKRGMAPTIREFMPRIGVASARGVTGHLDALERKGYIHREAFEVRAIKVLRDLDGDHVKMTTVFTKVVPE